MKVNLRKDPLAVLDALVEANVKLFKSDWYYNREKAKNCLEYYVIVRDDGVNFCPTDGDAVSYHRIICSKVVMDCNPSALVYAVINDTVRVASEAEAQKELFDIIINLPGKYIANEAVKTIRDRTETLGEWEAKQV